MVATLASLPLCAASFYAMDFQNSFALFCVVYLLVLCACPRHGYRSLLAR